MLTTALQAMTALATTPDYEARVAACKREFETRTGKFGPDDAWFEARSAAFFDDALTTQGLASAMAPLLSEEHRAFVAPLEAAHRGLFRAEKMGRAWVLRDTWSGIELVIDPPSDGLADALARASGYFDGRAVGTMEAGVARVTLLPGAVFHAEDASPHIEALLPVMRERRLSTHAALDALLRMDHALRSLSRVKAAFAYRLQAL